MAIHFPPKNLLTHFNWNLNQSVQNSPLISVPQSQQQKHSKARQNLRLLCAMRNALLSLSHSLRLPISLCCRHNYQLQMHNHWSDHMWVWALTCWV